MAFDENKTFLLFIEDYSFDNAIKTRLLAESGWIGVYFRCNGFCDGILKQMKKILDRTAGEILDSRRQKVTSNASKNFHFIVPHIVFSITQTEHCLYSLWKWSCHRQGMLVQWYDSRFGCERSRVRLPDVPGKYFFPRERGPLDMKLSQRISDQYIDYRL